MSGKSLMKAGIGAIMMLAGSVALGQTQYDISDDFSLDGNPNGAWSYGHTVTLGSPFILFPYSVNNLWGYDFIHAWQSGISWDSSPQIIKNNSDSVFEYGSIVYAPQQVILHPGINDEKSIARWTAPAADTYEVSATFEGRDEGWGTHTDVHVLINSISVFDDVVDGYLDTTSFADTFELIEGDTVDFVVGFGGDYFNGDSTGIDATITGGSATLSIDPDPLVSGQNATFAVTNAEPNENTYLAYSVRGMGSTFVPFLNVTLDLDRPKQAGNTQQTDEDGFVEWILPIPGKAAGVTVWLQAVQFENKTNVVESSIQ